MKIVYYSEKHDLKIYSEGHNLFRLDHGGEIIVESCPADRVKKVYNKIVDFHNKINYNKERV